MRVRAGTFRARMHVLVLCSRGKHHWTADGGRSCPKGAFDCSQTVFRCDHCGQYDYGEAGGPAHEECKRLCGLNPIKVID